MLILAGMLAVVSALFIGFHVRGELRSGGSWPIDRQFFFGAAFLLLAVHSVRPARSSAPHGPSTRG